LLELQCLADPARASSRKRAWPGFQVEDTSAKLNEECFMRSMRSSIRRDLLFGVILSALVFVSALARGGPFLAAKKPAPPAAAAHPALEATTLTGTVTGNGGKVYLNDHAGNIYQLDNVRYAGGPEGQYVSVTGELNRQARLMHVERIVPIDA
jgi:hypothetical protein